MQCFFHYELVKTTAQHGATSTLTQETHELSSGPTPSAPLQYITDAPPPYSDVVNNRAGVATVPITAARSNPSRNTNNTASNQTTQYNPQHVTSDLPPPYTDPTH